MNPGSSLLPRAMQFNHRAELKELSEDSGPERQSLSARQAAEPHHSHATPLESLHFARGFPGTPAAASVPLYQGMTSVMPTRVRRWAGFSPCAFRFAK